MKKEMKNKNNKGFSLVELIVVIAIMAVLMVVLAPAMLRYVEKTREQKDDSAVSEVANAVELALAQENIYAEAGGKKVEVQVSGAGVITAKIGDADAASSELLKDVKATVGDSIIISSKDRKGRTYTVTAEYIDDRQAYEVTGAWSPKPTTTPTTTPTPEK